MRVVNGGGLLPPRYMKIDFDTMFNELEYLLELGNSEVLEYARNVLDGLNYDIRDCNELFLFAQGRLPVLVVAHVDTFAYPEEKTIVYDAFAKRVLSDTYLGADDRAGVYAVLELARKYQPHVLLTNYEEKGQIGAEAALESVWLQRTAEKIKFIVELDRCGVADAVFYHCTNNEFKEFIISYGFEEKKGTVTDVTVLMEELGVAGVNLSVGFFNEHTEDEYLSMRVLASTIDKVSMMLDDVATYWIPRFEFVCSFSGIFEDFL